MTRQTSIIAYNTIKSNGVLGKLQMQVYDFLFHNGPLTQRELIDGLNTTVNTTFGIHQRFSELKKLKLIKDIGTTECDVTGMKVLLWDVTSEIVTRKPKETAQERIDKLSVRIEKLLQKKQELENEISKSTSSN